jgi:RHS repeat-associated protein
MQVRLLTLMNGSLSGTNTYTFDPLNRVTRMQQSGTGVTNKRVDYAYNAVGQPINVKRFADLAGTQSVAETTHTFDPLNRLTTINHSRGGVPLASYNYGYDANSRITRVTNKDGTSTNTYDDTDQLTGVNYNGSQPNETYTYDANGNRTNPGYVTGANNRLLSDGKFNYEYDGEGNVISQTDILTGEVTLYTWDYRNRLTNVTRNGVTVGDYAYDVYDQRIGKVTPAGTERLVYGQNQNIALEFDGSGALTNRYLHGNSIDEVLADEANGAVGWTLTDNLGSVRDVVDATGTSRNHVVFDSFGNVTSETNPGFKTRFSFTGREFDAETGNYDYRHRPYNPRSGKFIQEDPISFAGGDANLYRYVSNSPIDLIDPLGYQPRTIPRFTGNTRPGTNSGGRYDYRNPYSNGAPPKAPYDPTTAPSGNPITPSYNRRTTFGRPFDWSGSSNNSSDSSSDNDYVQQFCGPTYCLNPDTATPEAMTRLWRDTVNDRLRKLPTPPKPIPLGEFDPVRALEPLAPKPNQCNYKGECKPKKAGVPILGGSYSSVRKNNIGGEVNHMPAWDAIVKSGIRFGQLSQSEGYNRGPTICMTVADHSKTASYKGHPLSRKGRYRGAQSTLIALGSYGFDIAQNLDVLDVRGKFGSKYDYGIRQMQNYTELLQSQEKNLFR